MPLRKEGLMLRVIIYLLAILGASCAEPPIKKITSPNTYDKAMPFSQAEIKRAELEQENACAHYATQSKIRSKRMLAINAVLEDETLTKTQKLQKHHSLMRHINDDQENLEELRIQCDSRMQKLEGMYKANHLAGDLYLEERKNRK